MEQAFLFKVNKKRDPIRPSTTNKWLNKDCFPRNAPVHIQPKSQILEQKDKNNTGGYISSVEALNAKARP